MTKDETIIWTKKMNNRPATVVGVFHTEMAKKEGEKAEPYVLFKVGEKEGKAFRTITFPTCEARVGERTEQLLASVPIYKTNVAEQAEKVSKANSLPAPYLVKLLAHDRTGIFSDRQERRETVVVSGVVGEKRIAELAERTDYMLVPLKEVVENMRKSISIEARTKSLSMQYNNPKTSPFLIKAKIPNTGLVREFRISQRDICALYALCEQRGIDFKRKIPVRHMETAIKAEGLARPEKKEISFKNTGQDIFPDRKRAFRPKPRWMRPEK